MKKSVGVNPPQVNVSNLYLQPYYQLVSAIYVEFLVTTHEKQPSLYSSTLLFAFELMKISFYLAPQPLTPNFMEIGK
jgi:hypothetical protein